MRNFMLPDPIGRSHSSSFRLWCDALLPETARQPLGSDEEAMRGPVTGLLLAIAPETLVERAFVPKR